MERHIQEHVQKLPRFDDKIQYLTVTLAVDSGSHLAEVMLKCHRTEMVAQGKSHDIYQSIDEAFARLERQIGRHHDKRVRNRARAGQQASEENRRPG
jgi:ribosomal subunit interface protein